MSLFPALLCAVITLQNASLNRQAPLHDENALWNAVLGSFGVW